MFTKSVLNTTSYACIIYDNNLIHNINNNYSITINSSDLDRRFAVNKMATNIWCYFTLRMRDYPWHVSIRLAYIYSLLSSINIYPLLNTVLKIGTFEITSQYFAYFISISSLVFENDKWTFWGLLWAFQYVSPP